MSAPLRAAARQQRHGARRRRPLADDRDPALASTVGARVEVDDRRIEALRAERRQQLLQARHERGQVARIAERFGDQLTESRVLGGHEHVPRCHLPIISSPRASEEGGRRGGHAKCKTSTGGTPLAVQRDAQMTAIATSRSLLVLVLAALPASGDESRPPPPSAKTPTMTLHEALTWARAHQPQIRVALAELAARKSDAWVPRSAWLPRVGATAQALYGTANNTTASYVGVPEVDLARIGGSTAVTTGNESYAPSASTLAAATLSQEVFDFGRIAAEAAVADANVDVARAASLGVTLDVTLLVEETFHAVLAAREVQRATEEAYQRAITHRDYSQAGVSSGLRPPIELTRAQADVTQLDVRRVRAASGVEVARAALGAALGGEWLEVDAAPIASGEPPAPSFDEALRRAGERNPLIEEGLARVRAQQAAVSAIGRELAPNLLASATVSGRAGGAGVNVPSGDGWLPDVFNWDVGIVLRWNLFDATILGRRSAAVARVDAARSALELVHQQVTLAVQRAWIDLDATTRALPGLDAEVNAAKANAAQADARFHAGLGNVVELADAENILTRAELDRAVGIFDVARARARLARATADDPSAGTHP